MMESRIGNLKPISFPDSAAGPGVGARPRGDFPVWSPGAPRANTATRGRPLRARRALNTEATCGPGGRILMAAQCS